MDSKRYVIVTIVIFGLVAIVHLARMVFGWPVTINGFEVPIWASAIAFVIAGAMAVWGFQLLRQRSA